MLRKYDEHEIQFRIIYEKLLKNKYHFLYISGLSAIIFPVEIMNKFCLFFVFLHFFSFLFHWLCRLPCCAENVEFLFKTNSHMIGKILFICILFESHWDFAAKESYYGWKTTKHMTHGKVAKAKWQNKSNDDR